MIYPGTDGGSTVVDGRERDAVLVGREVVVAIEATRSRKEKKAEEDARKLKQLTERLAREYPTKAIRGFFVTSDEPLAQQRDAVRKYGGPFVTSLSLAALRKELFDAATYMDARADYAFGSARDPKTNSALIETQYIGLDLLEKPTLVSRWSVKAICDSLLTGHQFVLTGDYGIGKSMTLREAWMLLRKEWQKDSVTRIPVHLNLRDHQGQEDPSEALHRHASRIGFPESADLVRAWRSGQVVLLLDGFDEITFPGWTGRVTGLPGLRRRNVALVRNFISQSPTGTGIFVAGRSHFFDSDIEMEKAIACDETYTHLSASDFTDKQIAAYLEVNKLQASLPDWMPSRPLLVGYLASLGMLSPEDEADTQSAATGWDTLLSRICQREAQIDVGIDGETVRRIVERLASRARRTTSGRGPLRFDDLSVAFREVCGYQPDEGSRVVLDRLPGLGVGSVPNDEDSDLPREFVDEDLADAARAGDVFAFIGAPQSPGIAGEDLRDWDFLLDELGMEILLHRVSKTGYSDSKVEAALTIATKLYPDSGLVAELSRAVLALGGSIDRNSPDISDFVLPTLKISAKAKAGNTTFRRSIVQKLELEDGCSSTSVPKFIDVIFESISGATGTPDLPQGQFTSCTFGDFADSASNTAAIVGLKISEEVRVALIILEKIYLQRGRGRKENALVRGLPPALQSLVRPTLAALRSEQLVASSKSGNEIIWIPLRSAQTRVRHMLASPMSSSDSFITSRR